MADPTDTTGAEGAAAPATSADAAGLLERVLASPRMPSLPVVAAEVLDLVEEEEVDLALIAEAVTKDAALATRVLRTVNSSFYGQAYSVGTVGHALVGGEPRRRTGPSPCVGNSRRLGTMGDRNLVRLEVQGDADLEGCAARHLAMYMDG